MTTEEPPQVGATPDAGDGATGQASLSGNVLRAGETFPRVCGTMRIFPPLATQPLVEVINKREYAEAIYALSGPHLLEDAWIGKAPRESVPEVEYEAREGFAGEPELALITRYARTDEPGITMSSYLITNPSTTPYKLVDQSTPRNSVPYYHYVRSYSDADEFWITVNLVEGLYDQTTANRHSVNFRIRFREAGTSTWYYTPEIELASAAPGALIKQIKFIWGNTPTLPAIPADAGFIAAMIQAPTVIPPNAAVIGDFATTGNLNDGILVAVSGSCSTRTGTTGYAGWNFGESVKVISARIYGSSDLGLFDVRTAGTLKLYASNTAPASSSNGTLLATLVVTDAANVIATLTSSDQTTLYQYVWVEFTPTGGSDTIRVAELGIMTDNYGWHASNRFISTPTVINSGNMSLTTSNQGTSVVRNTLLTEDSASFYLDEATFPKGNQYEFEIIKSVTYETTSLATETYKYAGGAPGDLYGYVFASSEMRSPLSLNQTNKHGKATISRLASVRNRSPITKSGLALMAIRVHDRSVSEFSVLASGYVYDWDGSGWNDLVTTSNPAPHYRDVLLGSENARPLPLARFGEDQILTWRQECIDNGYEVNAVFQSNTVWNALNILAGAGSARPRASELWDVLIDKDTSGDAPVQIFTPRNLSSFRWEKAFPRIPDGFRMKYFNADLDYKEDELVVTNPESDIDYGIYEEQSIQGLVTPAEVLIYAERNFKQLHHRFVYYYGEADVEHLVCRRGDLVAVQHDIIHNKAGFANVKEVLTSGPNVTGLVLNGTVPTSEDLWFTGGWFTGSWFTTPRYGASIRLKNGTIITHEITGEPSEDESLTITFVTPFAIPGGSALAAGCLVATGELGTSFKRMKVFDIQSKQELRAQLTFVDEAPQIWS